MLHNLTIELHTWDKYINNTTCKITRKLLETPILPIGTEIHDIRNTYIVTKIVHSVVINHTTIIAVDITFPEYLKETYLKPAKHSHKGEPS